MKTRNIIVVSIVVYVFLYVFLNLLIFVAIFSFAFSRSESKTIKITQPALIEDIVEKKELTPIEDESLSNKKDDKDLSVQDEDNSFSEIKLESSGIKFKGDFYVSASKPHCTNINTPVGKVDSFSLVSQHNLLILKDDGSQIFDSALNTLKSKEIDIDTDKFLGDIQISCNQDNGEIIDKLLITKPDYFDEMRSILSYSHGGSMPFDIHDFVLEIRIIALKEDYLFNMEYLIFPFELVTRDEVSHCFDKDIPDLYNRECVIEKIMSKESANLEILDRAYDLLYYYELY